jgi:hypothetical protein
VTTENEMEDFQAAIIRHYMPIYKAAREIGLTHAECLEIETIKFKIDIEKEKSSCQS